MRMTRKDLFCPDWQWWIRTGERLNLGLDIMRVLGATGQGESRLLTDSLATVSRLIGEGNTVVGAFHDAGMVLPPEIWSLLESGEHTGRLGEAMCEVGNQLRERRRRRRELLGQLWYPALVVTTGIFVMLVILLWVVPQMRDVSTSMGLGDRLPWLTDHIGVLYGIVLVGMTGTGLMAILTGLGLAGLGRIHSGWSRLAEKVFRSIPGFGRLRQWRREARIFRQIGILLQGGVTLPMALDMSGRNVSSLWEKGQLAEFRQRLVMGTGFRECLEQFQLVSPEHRSLLLVGQESGRLDHFLNRLAQDLEKEISWRLNQWIRLLEPIILLFLSGAIGLLLLAYLLPMIRMMEQLA